MRPERLARAEFIPLIAMLVATTAFSIDSMLPAMTTIAAELTPDMPNRAQLVVTIFVLGMGLGTFFVGAVADAYGRRPVIIVGAVLYIAASILAYFAASLDTLLAARFIQGIAAAIPRVAANAVIRDLYAGRHMASIMSLILVVFTLVPVMAPALGAVVINAFGWRALFVSFVVFMGLSAAWFAVRQAETLDPADRRPLKLATFTRGFVEVLSNRKVALAILAQCFVFGVLFTLLTTTQPVFVVTFDDEAGFPLWFGLVALISASGAYLNSRIVERVGMRNVVFRAMMALGAAAALYGVVLATSGLPPVLAFPAYVGFMIAVFMTISFSIGNLNSLAMEPMGHLAGMAASVILAISTAGGAILGSVPAVFFDGTPLVPAILVAVYCVGVVLSLRWVAND
ncbi:MAG: multidrug effflux MFS transporter [Pseudomonadota bacterium]